MGIKLSDLPPQIKKQFAAGGKRKYRNQPTAVNGIRFDSQKEARRYAQLQILQQEGKIRNLKLQADFTLQEAYTTDSGERIRAIRYRADFTYERPTKPDCNGTVYWLPVVEDVKGKKTAVYAMKKKLMRERLGIEVQEV